MIDWNRGVQICLGPGGVGKTTVAAAAGIAGARAGERVVVLTIDPAHRLADTLGLARDVGRDGDDGGLGEGRELTNEPRPVEGPWPGELWAAMLDPAETLAQIVRSHGDRAQAERVLANPLFTTIRQSLSGVNEYMAAERLRDLHDDDRFDRVIIDTPPARHGVDFLDSPRRLINFVDNRFYRSVLAPRKGLARTLGTAAQLMVRLTAKLVGAELVHDVVQLFADLSALEEGFRQRAVETSALLAGTDCGYLLITTARRQPLDEAGWIRDNLERRGRTIDTLVVNRMTPFADVGPTSGGRKADRAALAANLAELGELGRREHQLIDELAAGSRRPVPALRIEERQQPLRTIEDLVEIADRLRADRQPG